MSQLRSKSKYRKGRDDGLEPLEPLEGDRARRVFVDAAGDEHAAEVGDAQQHHEQDRAVDHVCADGTRSRPSVGTWRGARELLARAAVPLAHS